MSHKTGQVTIQDVAQAAGVSVTTVSRVLNDKTDVSAATHAKVRAVIEELGYTSGLAAAEYAQPPHQRHRSDPSRSLPGI